MIIADRDHTDAFDAADTIRMQISWLADETELVETTVRRALSSAELEAVVTTETAR
jgi:hypothetical protein